MMMVTWTHHVNNNININTNARVVCVCVCGKRPPLPSRQKKRPKKLRPTPRETDINSSDERTGYLLSQVSPPLLLTIIKRWFLRPTPRQLFFSLQFEREEGGRGR
jgi:hypothetical protein